MALGHMKLTQNPIKDSMLCEIAFYILNIIYINDESKYSWTTAVRAKLWVRTRNASQSFPVGFP